MAIVDPITPFPEQQVAIEHHLNVLESHDASVEGSDTGVGKTIIGLGVARARESHGYLVICPKNAITSWRRTAVRMGTEPLDVLNIEKLKTGKTPWVTRVSKRKYEWNLPPGTLVLLDEAHRCGGPDSQNAYLLAAAKVFRLKVLAISATIADSPLRLRALGFLLGFHRFLNFPEWARKFGVFRNRWRQLQFPKGPAGQRHMKRLHEMIYPELGHRISIADIPSFPECQTFASAYDLTKYTDEVNRIYDSMAAELRAENPGDNPLVIMTRARRRAELLKVPLLVDLIQEYVEEEGKSVVVFVTYRETVDQLVEALADAKFPYPHSIIRGLQKDQEREDNHQAFLTNKTRLCICTSQAGGIAIDLDDQTGEYPRISLITPSYSAVELRQVLGRIHRASSKSKALQYILFAAGTVEDDACKSVRGKLDNLDLLNDGDLTAGIVDHTEEEHEHVVDQS
jgi:superfamily II DNA or RNA helicase